MIAIAKRQPESRSTKWHAAFLVMLPAIRRHARISFRSVPREAREELVQEVVANCLVAYRRLVELDRTDVAYPSALARFAVAQVWSGRRVAGKISDRDVMSRFAQQRNGFSVGRLNSLDPIENEWQEIVVEDRRATPADVATCRIDFASWLELLSRRQRKIALMLAAGETTNAAAKRFGLTAARISQLRLWLKESWERFQGDANANQAQLARA